MTETRFSDIEQTTPSTGIYLMTVDDVRAALGIADVSYDEAITIALAGVSSLIRKYTGQWIHPPASWKEVWVEPPVEAYLRQRPVISVTSTGATLVNKATGRTKIPESEIEYSAGYTELPTELSIVITTLIRQYLLSTGTWNGTGPTDGVRSVAIGNLRVEMATSSDLTKARGEGSISAEMLEPFHYILDLYTAAEAWATIR